MARFIQYSSLDFGSPMLDGTSGSLLSLLDSCLVSGYGDKPGSGWTKPLPNTGSYGIIKQPSGSGYTLFIDDTANWSGGASEARWTGYSSVTSIESGVPVGSDQFPRVAQPSLAGTVAVKKSVSLDNTNREWFVFADSSSFYFFSQIGVAAGNWFGATFGDIYSYSGSNDLSRCLIVGRVVQSASLATNDRLDLMAANLITHSGGHFMPHSVTASGADISIAVGKHGDVIKGINTIGVGTVPYPFGADCGLYLSPVYIHESDSTTGKHIKGTMRGFWQVLNVNTNLSHMQIISSSADGFFPGRNFMLIKPSGNTGMYCMELSDTLDTN